MQKFLSAAAVCMLLSARITAQVSISINTTSDLRAISPYIYGLNPYHYDNSLTGLNVHEGGINVSSLRFGGDAVSTYNWEKNVNISYDGSCSSTYSTNSNNTFLAYASGQPSSGYGLKAGAILKFYGDAASINAYPLVQLTAMQYAANDATGCLSSACGQGVTSGRMIRSLIQKPTALSLAPSLTDTVQYTDEELFYIRAQSGAPAGARGYCLENEPGIWNSTHPCAHAVRTTCGEVLTKNIELAKRVRTLDSASDIFGPGMYGFTEYVHLNYENAAPNPADWSTYNMSDTTYNAALYNQMTWIASYLRRMRNASNSYGKRLLDVLDLHYYNSGADLAQDSRSFWDSAYVENSYITTDIIGGASIKLVHCVKRAIADWYPGTKLGITEWGLLDNNEAVSGIYTADMLGAFGRNGVYLANYFGRLQGFTAGAFRIFRNYDGANSAYGNTSVAASSTDNSKVTTYAAVSGSNDSAVHIILINRTSGSQPASIHLSASRNFTTAQVWSMSGSGTGAITAQPAITGISNNTFNCTLAGRSVYHLVLRNTGTGVHDVAAVHRLTIYPNPATDRLYLEQANATVVRLSIYDMTGRKVLTQVLAPTALKAGLSLETLTPGNYLLEMNGAQAMFEKR